MGRKAAEVEQRALVVLGQVLLPPLAGCSPQGMDVVMVKSGSSLLRHGGFKGQTIVLVAVQLTWKPCHWLQERKLY